MTDDNGRRPVSQSPTTTFGAGVEEQAHGVFNPKSFRSVEPMFQMSEADWSQYGNSSNEKGVKHECHGTFYGYGFPSGPVKSDAPQGSDSILENGKVPQRYREASDSEWDAYERRKESTAMAFQEKTNTNRVSHHALQRRFSHSRDISSTRISGTYTSAHGPNSLHHLQQTRVPASENVALPVASATHQPVQNNSTKPDAPYRNFPSHHIRNHDHDEDQVGSNNLVDTFVDGHRLRHTKPLARKKFAADERAVGRPSRRHRQNVSRTDFEQICNALFSSDEETNGAIGEGVGTSVNGTHISDVEESFVNLRPTSVTSLSIDEFVNAGREEILFDRIPRYGEKDYLDASLHKNIHQFLSQNPLSSGALSVTVDLLEYPPQLVARPRNRLLRPVIIDGCAVAGCFDKEYSVHWGRSLDPTKLVWASYKVLPMKPICLTVAMFLLRGHKVTVLLPKYYLDATVSGMRNKVDDIEALKILFNLQIVQYAEQKGVDNVMDAIRREVDKVDALLISSGSFDVRDDWPRRPTFPQPSDQQQQQQLLPSAFTKASKRMLTPTFYGRNRDMTMSFGFHTKEDGTWRTVAEDHMCYYEPHMDTDSNIDDEGRLCQQLLFEDQVQLLVSLKDLFEWPALYRRAISAVLRLDHLATAS